MMGIAPAARARGSAAGLDGQPDRLGFLHAVGHVEAGFLALGGHGAGVRLPGALSLFVDDDC